MKQDRRQGWFETMRRDRDLFAFVAVFALALAIFQPALPAAAAQADALVICSVHGRSQSDGKSQPANHDECPCCTFGHLCGGLAPLAKALTPSEPAFDPFPNAATWRPASDGTGAIADSRGGHPPAIRAPPAA